MTREDPTPVVITPLYKCETSIRAAFNGAPNARATAINDNDAAVSGININDSLVVISAYFTKYAHFSERNFAVILSEDRLDRAGWSDARMVRATCLLASCALIALLLLVPASAYPRYPSNYYRDEGPYEPEEIMDMLNRLGNLIQIERKMENYKDDITSEKRALDMGLSRGYSGSIQAKHLMGLAAANYAGGPGRRRRDAH
ncbi:hypothetical protein K1T71_001130 [Dendrolimus kikuchii]|uniref:Uncharacterized protein n=1 Tax=Dendrolimus kikuchii TaxID=765133 RepID=A0ACC1DGP1_9NEOP|nr:hypothetical protein K1T71_001130 [Dendrolimus kikuchii]